MRRCLARHRLLGRAFRLKAFPAQSVIRISRSEILVSIRIQRGHFQTGCLLKRGNILGANTQREQRHPESLAKDMRLVHRAAHRVVAAHLGRKLKVLGNALRLVHALVRLVPRLRHNGARIRASLVHRGIARLARLGVRPIKNLLRLQLRLTHKRLGLFLSALGLFTRNTRFAFQNLRLVAQHVSVNAGTRDNLVGFLLRGLTNRFGVFFRIELGLRKNRLRLRLGFAHQLTAPLIQALDIVEILIGGRLRCLEYIIEFQRCFRDGSRVVNFHFPIGKLSMRLREFRLELLVFTHHARQAFKQFGTFELLLFIFRHGNPSF